MKFKPKKGMVFNVYESIGEKPKPSYPWLGSMWVSSREEADLYNLEDSWMQKKLPEPNVRRVGVIRIIKVKKKKKK